MCLVISSAFPSNFIQIKQQEVCHERFQGEPVHFPHSAFFLRGVYLNAHGILYGGVVLFAAAYMNLLKHDALLLSDLLLLCFGVFVIGCALITIRLVLKATNKSMALAMIVMIAGIPFIGYLGYLSHSITVTASLITVWLVLWAAYDEWERAPFLKL